MLVESVRKAAHLLPEQGHSPVIFSDLRITFRFNIILNLQGLDLLFELGVYFLQILRILVDDLSYFLVGAGQL